MKRVPPDRSRAGALAPIIIVLLVCIVPLLIAQAPTWWSDRGVVTTAPASDFAAANQGQLKTFTLAAYEEFLAKIPTALGGIGVSVPQLDPLQPESPSNRASPGWRLRNLISQWVQIDWLTGAVLKDGAGKPLPAVRPPGTPPPTDFAAINQGQIKAVTAPFYDRLAELYWSYNSGTAATSALDPAWAKPWTDATTDDNNHAMANLGQLKRSFALDLDSDADSDGLSNLAELLANANRGTTAAFWTDLRNAYSTGGQLTDGQQVALNLDPTNPANALPPTPPTGLRITFPDATVHPEDPDISKSRVEWDAPSLPGIAVTFQQTYTGNPGGWSQPMQSPSSSSSPVFSNLPSKRIHGYRVTFTGPNSLSASSEIAYEVPVIRGIMQRRKPASINYPGATVFDDATYSGIARKYEQLKYTWEYDRVRVQNGESSTYHEEGEHTESFNPSSRMRTFDDLVNSTTESGIEKNESYHMEVVEPSPNLPVGNAYLLSSVISDSVDRHVISADSFDLALTLSKYASIDGAGNLQPPRPFGTASGTYQSTFSDIIDNGDPESYSSYFSSDSGAVSLQNDFDGQHPARAGTRMWTTIEGTGDPETLTAPYNEDLAELPVGILPQAWFGYSGDFSSWSGAPPEGAVVSAHTSPTTWTRSWTHTIGNETTTWTETVTLTNEITTEDWVNASAAESIPAPSQVLGWFIPYTGTALEVFHPPLADFEFHKWLGWGHEAVYTPSVTPTALAAASVPGKSYVTVEPDLNSLVGEYWLATDEASGWFLSSEYKFRIYPPAESCEIVWEETFTPDQPDPVPPGWTPAPQHRVRTLIISPGQNETPVQSVDRTEGFSSQSGAPPNTEAQQAAPPGTRVPGSVILGIQIASKVSLRVDRNHNGTFDGDGDLAFAKYPMGLVVDVNNIPVGTSQVPRNTDAALSFPEKNGMLGYAKDQRVEPLLVNLPNGIPADVKLRVRNPDTQGFPEGNGRIRLFTEHDVQAISPAQTVYTLTEQEKKASVKFWIEGTEPGEVIIDLEYTFMVNGAPRTEVKRVRFEVNVDNPPKDPLKETNKIEARNRVRAIKQYPRVTGIYADFNLSREPLLTWHRKPRSVAYASMWVGIETDKFAGGYSVWAQGGLHARSMEGGKMQQGAKPYGEIATDYARFRATKNSDFYTVAGALKTLPNENDRRWVNQEVRVMYRKGAVGAWQDELRVRTNGLDKSLGEDLVARESAAEQLRLEDKVFVIAQAGFEASQSVTRVPGINTPNGRARIGGIAVCVGPTAAGVVPGTGEVAPANFQLIALSNADLEIVTVGNDGTEVKHTAPAFSHYRIQLEESGHDVRLWDKYYWDAYDPFRLPTQQNPGGKWEGSP